MIETHWFIIPSTRSAPTRMTRSWSGYRSCYHSRVNDFFTQLMKEIDKESYRSDRRRMNHSPVFRERFRFKINCRHTVRQTRLRQLMQKMFLIVFFSLYEFLYRWPVISSRPRRRITPQCSLRVTVASPSPRIPLYVLIVGHASHERLNAVPHAYATGWDKCLEKEKRRDLEVTNPMISMTGRTSCDIRLTGSSLSLSLLSTGLHGGDVGEENPDHTDRRVHVWLCACTIKCVTVTRSCIGFESTNRSMENMVIMHRYSLHETLPAHTDPGFSYLQTQRVLIYSSISDAIISWDCYWERIRIDFSSSVFVRAIEKSWKVGKNWRIRYLPVGRNERISLWTRLLWRCRTDIPVWHDHPPWRESGCKFGDRGSVQWNHREGHKVTLE